MGKLLSGWREWSIAVLAALDCVVWVSFFLVPSFFVLEYLISISFRYVMPFLFILHYSIDGFRWQLYPIYVQLGCILLSNAYIPEATNYANISKNSDIAASTFHAILSTSPTLLSTAEDVLPLVHQPKPFGISLFRVPGLNLALRFLVSCKVPFASFSFFLCWLFPFPSFPEPDGSWGCGVEEFQFTATATQQLKTPDELQRSSSPKLEPNRPARSTLTPRPFQSLVFYPIEKHRHKNESRYRWLSLGRRSVLGLSRMMGLPRLLFSHLLRLETQSVMLAPLSKKRRRYPIVFLSHGLAMMKTSQSMLCQTLASHGYIVVSIEHTDGTAAVTTSNPPRFFAGSVSLSQRCVLSPLAVRKSNVTQTSSLIYSRSSSSSWTGNDGSFDAGQQLRSDVQALTELMQNDGEDAEKKKPDFIGDDTASSPQSPATSTMTREQEFRHAQLKIRTAEILAAHDAMSQMSRTIGSSIKDRVDWDASSVIGYGFGGASALLACIFDYINRHQSTATTLTREQCQPSPPAFKSCVLLCPWLDPIMESEFRLSEWLKNLGFPTTLGTQHRLPQNFMMVNTTEQINAQLTNQIRLIKLMKDATGDKTILQFSRCKSLDLTDIPMLAPRLFRYLELSGPRDPKKSAQMINRVVCNFLSHHYRRSLFTVSSGLTSSGSRAKRRRNPTPPGLFSAGSESETASGVLSVGSLSDASSSHAAAMSSRHPTKNSMSALKTRYGPSLLNALRLAGIPDHYIRGLGGLRTPVMAKELSRLLQPDPSLNQTNEASMYDVMEGIVEFLDDQDCSKRKDRSQIPFNPSVAEICHI